MIFIGLPIILLAAGIFLPMIREVRMGYSRHLVVMGVAVIVLAGLVVGLVYWKKYKNHPKN